MQNDNDDDDDFDFVNAKNRGGGKEILLKVGVHEHMVDSSTAAEAAETEATNEHKQTDRKPDKTRAQKDAHNAACRMSRLKRKMDVEKLEADYLQTKKKFHKMQVEHQSMYTVMRADLQSMYTKLEERNSEITLLKTALRILGINFTSVKELQEWILSLKYEKVGQGSGPNDTNVTASAAAGPSFVATHDHSPNNAAGTNGANITAFAASGPSFPNHGLPNNAPDNNSFSHDPAPAAGSPTASALGSLIAAFPGLNYMFDDRDDHGITYLFTDHALAAAGSSFIAGHESPVMFDAPNNHDTINNRSTYDPAAGFPSASAAGSSSYDSGGPGLSTAFAAGSSSAANHNLHARKSYDISGLFTHDPAADKKAGLSF